MRDTLAPEIPRKIRARVVSISTYLADRHSVFFFFSQKLKVLCDFCSDKA